MPDHTVSIDNASPPELLGAFVSRMADASLPRGSDALLSALHRYADFEDSNGESEEAMHAARTTVSAFAEVLASQLHRRGSIVALANTLAAFTTAGMAGALANQQEAARVVGQASGFASAPVGMNDPRTAGAAEQPEAGVPGVVSDDDAKRLEARNRAERGLPPLPAEDGAEDEAS